MGHLLESVYNNSPVLLQNLFLNTYAIVLHLERYGKKFNKKFAEMDKTQWYSHSELEEYQNEKLRHLIKHAYDNIPYYRRIMQVRNLTPQDIKTTSDMVKLPTLTRDDIRQNFEDLLAVNYRRSLLRLGHTSGTTGSPLEFYWDISTCVVHHVADWRQKKWAGLEYGEKFASIQGRTIVPISQIKPPFWRMNWLHNQLFLSSFHLKSEDLPYYFDKLDRFKPKAIEGYPSTLYILARYLDDNNISFPIESVLTSSETLFPIQREVIERAFDCKVFDFYGMAERVVYASECEQHEGHHLNMDYGITEILNENDEPVPKGKTGRIVATGLYNYAMPLIRYKTSDVTSIRDKRCPCGREFPLMDDVTTKDEDIVVTPGGKLISPSVLTHPFKPMHNIEESQIIQEEKDQLLVKIVKRPQYTEKDTDQLISAMQHRLGKEMKISIEFVDSIPRTKSGKFRWVISKMPLEFT